MLIHKQRCVNGLKSTCFPHFPAYFNICIHIVSKFTLIVHEILQKVKMIIHEVQQFLLCFLNKLRHQEKNWPTPVATNLMYA